MVPVEEPSGPASRASQSADRPIRNAWLTSWYSVICNGGRGREASYSLLAGGKFLSRDTRMMCWLLEEQEHKVQKAKLPKSLGTGMLPGDASCQVRPEVGVKTSCRITRLLPPAS